MGYLHRGYLQGMPAAAAQHQNAVIARGRMNWKVILRR